VFPESFKWGISMSTLFGINEILDTVIHGDALEVLKTMPNECIDAIVCDPPSSINFMNRSWDDDKGGRTQWVAWLSSIMRECRRVLKSGGHALVWSLPRTSHWTALALEDAGFEIRDQIYNLISGDTLLLNFLQSLNEEQQHAFVQVLDAQREPNGILQIFGQGFPKSANISAMIDKLLGKERDVIGIKHIQGLSPDRETFGANDRSNGKGMGFRPGNIDITAPASEEAQKWHGWHSALKPAVENWWLVRKPLAASSIAENVLTYGTGAINVDACRIGTEEQLGRLNHTTSTFMDSANGTRAPHPRTFLANNSDGKGRFPSHLLLTHTPSCIQVGTKRVRGGGGPPSTGKPNPPGIVDFGLKVNGGVTHRDEDGMETVTAWQCPDSCPVRVLDAQGGLRKSGGRVSKSGDEIKGQWREWAGSTSPMVRSRDYEMGSSEGYVSRYFQQLPALDDIPPYIYAGKASRRDRTADNTVNNTHPTVKSLALSKYLVKLICPPNGIVLDCFAGSGSTLVAAIHEGFHFIGVEKEEEYVNIARARIDHALSGVGIVQHMRDMPLTVPIAAKTKKARNIPHSSQLSLWGEDLA
jgi:site-specific DNA-methyltransferase (adenine-specific)